MVVCDVIYKIEYLDFPKYFYYTCTCTCILYYLIMLTYARNQTFCSKSVDKAPKVQIFGLNTLCSILSNCTWKNSGIKINFLHILLFCEFLMFISFFFWPFVLVVFFTEICGRHFLKHNKSKTNYFQQLRAKICIFIWTKWKTQFALILYTKSHFGAIFGLTCMYTMLRKKENCHRVSRWELCALPSNRAIHVEGGGPLWPPSQSN